MHRNGPFPCAFPLSLSPSGLCGTFELSGSSAHIPSFFQCVLHFLHQLHQEKDPDSLQPIGGLVVTFQQRKGHTSLFPLSASSQRQNNQAVPCQNDGMSNEDGVTYPTRESPSRERDIPELDREEVLKELKK